MLFLSLATRVHGSRKELCMQAAVHGTAIGGIFGVQRAGHPTVLSHSLLDR